MVAIIGVLLGFSIIVFGALGTFYPRKVTRVTEQIDAIGSKRDLGEVEPAEWNVKLTKAMGVGAIFFGLVITYLAIID